MPIPARAPGREELKREHIPGLVLGTSSILCMLAAVGTGSARSDRGRTPDAKSTRRIATTADREVPTARSDGRDIRRSARTSGRSTAIRAESLSGTEMRCLAGAMWHEAGNQSDEGRIAVGRVVMARRGDPRFAPTTCGVLKQKNQFSFVHGGVVPSVPVERKAEFAGLAKRVADGAYSPKTKGALWFHATYVRPSWKHDIRRLGRIGAHVFYGDGERTLRARLADVDEKHGGQERTGRS